MAVTEIDPYKLSSPRTFLLRMIVFVILAGLVAGLLYEQIIFAFMANPGLNALIIAVLAIGILLALRQVIRLFPEIAWVNSFRLSDPGLAVRDSPTLLAPMAALLGNRPGHAVISPTVLRSILDSVGSRLDESRDIARYLTGLLVFLGLLGTFWGLLETVSSIGNVINALDVGEDSTSVFADLKQGLAQPLSGMGISFSSSLFGLAGSLVLGFLDLQAGQAQNRFYNELEDWLSATVADVTLGEAGERTPSLAVDGGPRTAPAEVVSALDRLSKSISEGSGGRSTTQAMAHLAEGIQGLVTHMRAEQQMMREWVESQAEQQKDIRRLLAKLARENDTVRS